MTAALLLLLLTISAAASLDYAEYAEFASQELSSPSARFLVVDLAIGGGFGTRLRAIVGALVQAMVTRRVLLVGWPADTGVDVRLDELFVPPWEWDARASRALDAYAGRSIKHVSYGDARGAADVQDTRVLLCQDIRADWEPYDVVVVRSSDYHGIALEINRHFRDELQARAPFGFLFQHLFAKLFVLQPGLADMVEAPFAGYSFETVLGLHLRAGDLAPGGPAAAARPGAVGALRTWEQVERLVAFAAEHVPEGQVATFFVATDSPGILPTVRNALLPHHMVTLADSGVGRDAFRPTRHSVIVGLVELWILGARTARLIRSYGSTYGCAAVGVAGIASSTLAFSEEYPAGRRISTQLPTPYWGLPTHLFSKDDACLDEEGVERMARNNPSESCF